MHTKNASRTLGVALAALTVTLAACVTINVYFPAVAAEQAADRIIQDVWRHEQSPSLPEEAEPQGRGDMESGSPLIAVLDFLLPTAAASSPDLDVSSPAIRSLTAAMESRHSNLRQHYESGAIGLTNDGRITIRDQGAISLQERNRVRQLVADENADRQSLYRQIAVANGHPEWESDIRDTFAERWIANARSGWYYQDSGGNWQQK